MRYSNLAAIACVITFLLLGLLYGTSGVQADRSTALPEPTLIINPKAVKTITTKLGPDLTSDFCDPNGGLLAKKCKGYRLQEDFLAPNLLASYTKLEPKYCTYNQDYNPMDPSTKVPGNFRCIFRAPKKTCSAYVAAHNDYNNNNNQNTTSSAYYDQGLPWTATPLKNSNGTYQCYYCKNGEAKQTAADGTKYCPNGNFLVALEDPLLFGPYPDTAYFCTNLQVNGPYSQLPDDFTACGASYSQGVPGALFTYDQRTSIKTVNQLHYNLPDDQNISDLAGFCFPKPPSGCGLLEEISGDRCKEPSLAMPSSTMQVHHIVPRSDATSCPCGTNSPQNAAVISAKLNGYISNKDLTTMQSSCGSMDAEPDIIASLGEYNLFTAIVYKLNRLPKYDVSRLSAVLAARKNAAMKVRQRSKQKNKHRH